jgi:hypothetical protein
MIPAQSALQPRIVFGELSSNDLSTRIPQPHSRLIGSRTTDLLISGDGRQRDAP